MTAMALGNLANDRKTQAAPFDAVIRRAMETFEDPLALGIRHAGAPVLHLEQRGLVVKAETNRKLATVCTTVTKPIVDQIVQRFTQHNGISEELERLAFALEGDGHATTQRIGRVALQDIGRKRFEIDLGIRARRCAPPRLFE